MRTPNMDISGKLRFALAAVAILPLLPSLATGAAAQATSRTFTETGHTVQGKFLQYWNSHGALPQQGYPISEEMQEKSDTDGKTYTVQYFERAVFELHPENAAPNDILLSLLGNFLYKQKYPVGAPNQAANSSPGVAVFPQTGKALGGTFLEYWKAHGGLAQQGYPISNEFTERSDLDGKTYTVQYFERAVFELHPENKPPYNVLLSQLGTFRYKQAYSGFHVDTFEKVWQLVRDRYVYTDFRGLNWQEVHETYLAKVRVAAGETEAYDAIADMIQKLGDKHSSFINPAQAREDDAMQRGELKLSGIGVITQQADEGVRIIFVIPGAPADKAGLKPFDLIKAVNGTPISNLLESSRLVRGAAGTSVTLTILSATGEQRDVTIVRDNVTFTYHATARRLSGTNTVFLDLPTFYQFGIADEVASVLNAASAQGPVDGLIIDVRRNGGGFLSELEAVERLFINGGTTGYEATRTQRTADTVPAGFTLPAYRGKKIVLLVSKLCESACERFSVAMHDLKRATLLGTTTAGNTETVMPYNLADGSRLNLAHATFQRVDGTSIEDKGLEPDLVVDVPWYLYSTEQDPQVLAAENLISGK